MAAIDNDWLEPMSAEFKKPYYRKLYNTVKSEYESREIYPAPDDIFNAFAFTPLAAISASVALPFSSITRSVNAMLAPSSANLSAMALPMPRAAPVIRAVLPVNNPILLICLICFKKSFSSLSAGQLVAGLA